MTASPDPIDEAYLAGFRQRVRSTAFWATIGGGLMLYFGIGQWITPPISPLYAAAAHTYIWTLRIGGGAMLAVAGLCLTGWGPALLLDAAACGLIAILLAFAGALFLSNGETNGLLSLVFALLFGGAGRQSWDLFVGRPRSVETTMPDERTESAAASQPPHETGAGARSLLEAIRRQRQGSSTPAASPPARPPQAQPAPEAPPPARPLAAAEVEPAEGFLAELAREDKERKT